MFFAAAKIATFPHSGIFIRNVRLSICNIVRKKLMRAHFTGVHAQKRMRHVVCYAGASEKILTNN